MSTECEFWDLLEQIFKQLKVFGFLVEGGQCCSERVMQLRNVNNVIVKLAELLLLANCWTDNKIGSASNVAGVFSLRNCQWFLERALFVSRKSPKAVIGNLLLKSCHRVTSLSWVWVMWIVEPTKRELNIRVGIALGRIPSWLLVIYIVFQGYSQHSSWELFVSVDSTETRLNYADKSEYVTLLCWPPVKVFW